MCQNPAPPVPCPIGKRVCQRRGRDVQRGTRPEISGHEEGQMLLEASGRNRSRRGGLRTVVRDRRVPQKVSPAIEAASTAMTVSIRLSRYTANRSPAGIPRGALPCASLAECARKAGVVQGLIPVRDDRRRRGSLCGIEHEVIQADAHHGLTMGTGTPRRLEGRHG
jgi:hypothetical protein